VSVVKQKYVAAAQSTRQPLEYDAGVGIDRIESPARPACEPQLQTGQHRFQERTAQSRGRAEESRPLTRYGLDRVLCTRDLGRNSRRSKYRNRCR